MPPGVHLAVDVRRLIPRAKGTEEAAETRLYRTAACSARQGNLCLTP